MQYGKAHAINSPYNFCFSNRTLLQKHIVPPTSLLETASSSILCMLTYKHIQTQTSCRRYLIMLQNDNDMQNDMLKNSILSIRHCPEQLEMVSKNLYSQFFFYFFCSNSHTKSILVYHQTQRTAAESEELESQSLHSNHETLDMTTSCLGGFVMSYHQKSKHQELAKHTWGFNWNHVIQTDETEIQLFRNKQSRVSYKIKDNYVQKHIIIPY